jgi:hypothetical protein
MKLKVKSQLKFREALPGGSYVLDDCVPSSVAAAVGWVTGYAIDPGVQEGIDACTKAGRKDVQGVPTPTSFDQAAKAASILGAAAVWPRSWEQVRQAVKDGAAILVNVQAPINYTESMLVNNPFAMQRKVKKESYGHCIMVAWDNVDGWQMADPTMTGEGNASVGASITEESFRNIARSKGDEDWKRCLIITKKKPKPAPVTKAPVRRGV